MNSRSVKLLLLCLPLLAVVWLLWPQARRASTRSIPGAQSTAAAKPVAVAAAAAKSLSLTASNSAAASVKGTNKFSLRLTNTTKSLSELAHDPRAILLANALIDTRGTLDFKIPKKLKSAGDPGAYIVQAHGNIGAPFRSMLSAAGAQIISYIPNNAYLVRASASQAADITGSGLAAAVIPYEPYYKMSYSLLAPATQDQPLPTGQILNIGVFADAAAAVQKQLAAMNIPIVAQDQSPFGPIFRVQPPASADWTALAQLSGVQAMEPTYRRHAANDLSRVSMGVSLDTLTSTNYLNLYGSNVVVEVNDSGIDATHPDFTLGGTPLTGPGGGTRIFGDSAGSLTDTDGHGTHVAGIIAGNGAESWGFGESPMTNVGVYASGSVSNADFRGKAPLASLYSVAFLGNDPVYGRAANILAPDIFDMSDYYLQTASVSLTNALISNNSWTYGGDNTYDLAAASYDAAVRDALPMVPGSQPVLFVFAAGNDGGGNDDGNGATPDTIESPATGKNVITVGALEQFRDITNIVTEADGSSNAVWQPETDSSTQVASYSARGNVGIGLEGDGGRFKPDVMAPGTFVVSTRSGQWNQQAYYDPTNYSTTTLIDQVATTNPPLSPFYISIPPNAVGVNIQVYPNTQSPVPFPTNMPIYVADNYDATPTTFDFATSNDVVNIPPDGIPDGNTYLQTIQQSILSFEVGDPTNYPINYNLSVTVITTNDVGNYFEVLSNLNNTLGPYYRYESGTSMGAAAVSGVLALMQDFFTNQLHTGVSPALLKAMLINGARSVGNYQFSVTNAPNDEGWGLVNLPTSIPEALTNLETNPNQPYTPFFFQDQSVTNSLATGDSQTFQVAVAPAAQELPMRVTLTWTDPPGNPNAAIKLVNNLDVVVTNVETGDVFYGNNFATAGNPVYSEANATNEVPNIDVVNNVRNIYLQPALGSNYTVTVIARSVNVNALTAQSNSVVQDFALVISSGDGSVTNALTVVANPTVRNPTADQDVTYVTTTNNTPLLNQIAGENSPLVGTNTVGVETNLTLATNELVTVGMTNQWHFYVVTNALGYTNAAFITFFPMTMALPTMGVFADQPNDATRPESDVDLYVANESSLTNLDPAVISNCVNGVGGDAVSAGRGGTEFVAYSNSVLGQVYYIGVKSEDHLGSYYGFLPVFSAYPFSSMNADGSESVYGIPVPNAIPDGTPKNPGTAFTFALALYPMTIDEVIETNQIWHQNFGDLYGTLSHANVNDVINNHDGFGNTTNTLPGLWVYYDAINNPINTPIGPVTVLNPRPSDGPGSLRSYQGQPAIGPWILTEVDNAYTHVGTVENYGLRIYPHTPAQKGLDVYIAGQSAFNDYIDVPAGVTNMVLAVTNETLPAEQPPLQVYLRFGQAPVPEYVPTVYDQMTIVSNNASPYVSGDISVGPTSIPPLQPGRYYFEVYNPSVNPATNVYIIANFSYAAVHGGATFTSTTVPTALPDDAVMTNTIVITNTDNIFSASVGVVVNHPRVSDLTLTLLSPAGQRYVLFENRGGDNATNLGHLNISTNFFGTVSAGNQYGNTNVIGPVPPQGTLLINYDFFAVPDQIDVYYDGVDIFSDFVNFSGQFSIPYGPGTGTNITIVMDNGGDPDGTSLWTYTPAVVDENYTYLTFTDDTNYAQIPIKFAIPPYNLTDLGTNYTLTSFEADTNVDYIAPTNILDAYGGWFMYTNMYVPTNAFSTGTNYIILTNNEVSVLTDPATAYDGSNYLALALGTITRSIPTILNREYSVSYSYRGPGIAGWWRGEGNATDSADPETNGANGLLIGRFTFPAGVVGQAFEMADQGHLYQFAGTNNYVQVPRSPVLDVGAGDGLTVEGWINPSNLYTQEPLVEWLSRMPTNPVVTNIVIEAGPFLDRATGHYYYMLGPTNWTTSEIWATNMGGHLVTINDANEQAWVYDTFANYAGTNRNLWIGLNDAAVPFTYVWSSGQNSTYQNWETGEPTNCSAADFYAVMLGNTNGLAGNTNGQAGLWRLQEDNGDTCGVTGEPEAYGVVELDDIPTNGVQLWVSVTNSPATGGTILSSNGCLYADLIDITNGLHEIWSVPGLIQSNYYQHVALTYSTNTGIATLYYEGTNVCSTNLGYFIPKTTGDVLLGKDMSRLTNNYYSGEMDEMSVYGRCLSDAEIRAIYSLSAPSTNFSYPTNGTLPVTVGKFDPAFNPAISLAEALVTLGGRTNLILGANTNWQRVNYTFIATTNLTPLTITGIEPGMLLDDFTVSETALGNLYYQPEQPLDGLIGESAAGAWTLEIQDNRANDTNTPAQLVSWQLNFILQTNTPIPITLYPEMPATNTVPPGGIAYFYVPIPDWANWATNILVSASGPVNLLYNPTNFPTGLLPGDVNLLGGPVTTGVAPVLPTGPLPVTTNGYSLTTNSYYLGVQNTNTLPVQFSVRVDFDMTYLSNNVPMAAVMTTNQSARYFDFDVSTNNAVEATFQLLKLTGNADLVASYGTPIPNLTNSAYGSFNVSNLDQNIYVLTNSLPVPLAPGRWYLGVFPHSYTNAGFGSTNISFTILAKELDAGQTNVINLTNNVPFTFTAGAGADLTNFFHFSVTNYAPQIYFKLYNLTGNGDLTVQSNALPLAPPFFESSQQGGLVPEYVYLRTNSSLTNLNADWYLGVPSHETNTIQYTIVAVNDSALLTNTTIAFPGVVGSALYTPGGRGSTNVYHVVNLNDDGPGSLRYGTYAFTNGAYILFDVSGNIPLQSPLVISNSYLTIAGQTAPGDGITLQNYSTFFDGAHDIILRYLRFRPGDTGTNLPITYTNFSAGDSIAFTNAYNIVLDHVSASWSTNAVLSVLDSTNITVEWSLISDSFVGTNGLTTNNLPGNGAIVRYGGGSVSFNHNLYADNYVSSPLLGDNVTLDFVNNVVYNWGLLPGWSLTNDPVANPFGSTNMLNFAANYFIATTNSQTNYIAFWGGSTNTWIFQTNNFIETDTNFPHIAGGVTNFTLSGADTGWGMFTNAKTGFTEFGEPFPLSYPAITNIENPSVTFSNVTIPTATAEEAYQAYEKIMDFAGDGLQRDAVDLHLIRDVRQQTNVAFIASQSQAGGWPNLSSGVPTQDTDGDGLPDYWEITFGLNPTNALDSVTNVNSSGYTALEVYLNWLASPHAVTTITNPVAVNLYHLAGGTGRLTFSVTNALNGWVYLTNNVVTNYFYTNSIYTNTVVTYTNALAVFTPSNNYISSFTNPASFDVYVTNNDTFAWIGPVTVSVVVSGTNSLLTSPPIVVLTNGVPFTVTNDPVYEFSTVDSPGAVVFQLYNMNAPAGLVLQTNGAPVPPNYLLTSGAASLNPAQIVVQTNFALTNIGATAMSPLNQNWFVAVTNVANYTTNPFTYTIMATEVPVSPTVINLTNGVPFNFTAGPGADLTNFFRFSVSDSPSSVQFQLYNQSGNGDLTVQTNALPFAPEYYQISRQPGNNSEAIQVSTNNGGPASLNAQWFLGVPDNDPTPITYTIVAQESFVPPPIIINTNTTQTNVIESGQTLYYLVNVPDIADLATNDLISASGPVNLGFSTNNPPTFGQPNDALLLSSTTSGISVFGTNAMPEITGSAQMTPGGFYYLAVNNPGASPVTTVLQVNFHENQRAVTGPIVTTVASTNVAAYVATLLGTVNPGGATSTVWFAYGLTTNYTSASASVLLTNSLYSTFPISIGVTNLLPGNTYHFRAAAANSVATNYGVDLTFTTPVAAPLVTTVAASGVTASSATLNASVNPGGAVSTVWFQYGTNTAYGEVTGVSPLSVNLNTTQPVALGISGLLPGVTYHFRAVGANSAGTNFGGDLAFTTPALPPIVVTTAATSVSNTTATIHANVHPNGAATTVSFEYGTSTSYGSVAGPFQLNSNLNGAQDVAAALSGLLPGVTYHFQALGTNSAGGTSGGDLAFTTPPVVPAVVTEPATNLTSAGVTLPALVNPGGAATTVYFAFGTTTNYGSLTPVTVLSSNLNTAQLASVVLTGLQSGVVYHYQAVATNSAGMSVGADLMFTNPVAPVSISSIVFTNNGYLLSWYAATNDIFKVQWIGSLQAANWATFTNVIAYTGPVTPTNGLFSMFDNGSQSGGFGAMRFYRLSMLPPQNTNPPSFELTGTIYYVNPLTTLTVTNIAFDANLQAALTYTVSGSLSGTNQPVIGANSGVITWTPSLAQAGMTNVITTVVSDNQAIALTATNTIIAIVNQAPAFTSVQVSTNGVTLTWSGTISNQFQIGWTTNLLSPWTFVPAAAPYITSTTTNFVYHDTNALTGQKFYQLRLLSQ